MAAPPLLLCTQFDWDTKQQIWYIRNPKQDPQDIKK